MNNLSEEEKKAYQECVLCPRRCHANRLTGTGFCGERAVPAVARASLHHWEEPCISGKTGSGTVFFCGCNLGCVYCQNAAISGRGRIPSKARFCDCQELAKIFLLLQEKGACNINLVTPTHFAPTVARAVMAGRARGLRLPIVWNTSGYETVETLRMLDGVVDIYLTDCKYASSEPAGKYSSAPDYFNTCMMAIREMLRQTGAPVFVSKDGKSLDAAAYNELAEETDPESDYEGPLMRRGVIVRHLLLPGEGEDARRIIGALLGEFGNSIYLSIMNQYTPMPGVNDIPNLKRRITENEYEEIIDYAIEHGLENGFFQGSDTASESFIPDF